MKGWGADLGVIFAPSTPVPRQVQDHYLPDHDAFLQSDPPTGRVIVIAPTRAACETIELALGLHIETYLEQHHGARVRELARSGRGFGIVAGTGTGKTLAIRPIAEEILRTELKTGVVNREREATPETPSWNVIVVTTGIARRWFEEGDILKSDTLVVDEIHQTSAELELCLALGKRVGNRFIWLSATVDPKFYASYLESADVLQVYSYDPKKAAQVRVVNKEPLDFLDDKFLRQNSKQRRGVALFVPTRRGVEEAAEHVSAAAPRVRTAFYHGGEPIRIIRPFLEAEGEQRPYFLAMTAAGQSALNVRGLDTVIIHDKRFFNTIDRGRNVLTQEHLGANELLQMAGRVHGRVEGGRVFILSDRDIQFDALRPTEPEFQLAGDSERVAMTCAALGVRADELELPVPLDKVAYRQALALLEERGIVERGRLTAYGRDVEAMPVERPWAELLVNADDELMPYVAVMSAIESLHRMTREERDLNGVIVPGSDHLTAYNLYAEAYEAAGYVGEVYGLPRHLFREDEIDAWAERRGVLVKAIEDAALGMASVYRSVGMSLPSRMPNAGETVLRGFQELLARYMPFTLVIDEETASGDQARVSKTSVCGSWGPIAGEIRYFADKFGVPRASIEGTQVPYDLVRQHAHVGAPELSFDPERKRSPLVLKRRVTYYGFELEREVEAVEVFPEGMEAEARHAIAEALARGAARHASMRRNQEQVEEVREVYRRSGGKTPRLAMPELVEHYEKQLANVNSVTDFKQAAVTVSADDFVPAAERARYLALPSTAEVRGREVEIHYDVEQDAAGAMMGVARLRLPEKIARTLAEEELPTLDRPLRFIVTRGARGAARASTLAELQEELDRPFTDTELEELNRAWEARREERRERKQQKRLRETERDLRRGRSDQNRGDDRGRPRGRGERPRFERDGESSGGRGRGGRGRGRPGRRARGR